MELKVSDITEVLDCEIVRTLSDGSIIIRIGTEQHNLNLLKSENNEYEFILDHTFHHAKIIQSNSMETKTLIDGQPMTVKKHLKLTQVLGKSLSLAELGGGINSLTSQIPGRVVSVLVEPGNSVKKGDAVVILESMKMQKRGQRSIHVLLLQRYFCNPNLEREAAALSPWVGHGLI